MGWEAVGLDRGDDQVRIPDGRMLFCNGLGRGVAPRIQRVLTSRSTTTPFHTFAAFSTPVPAACTPGARRIQFCFAWIGGVVEQVISPDDLGFLSACTLFFRHCLPDRDMMATSSSYRLWAVCSVGTSCVCESRFKL
jgi:hypothetical protein